jgi:hypothetical protein
VTSSRALNGPDFDLKSTIDAALTSPTSGRRISSCFDAIFMLSLPCRLSAGQTVDEYRIGAEKIISRAKH